MATYKQVSYGSQGSDVKTLQEMLNNNGYNLTVDGIFGTNTQAAVKDYQQKNNLAVDGIVGTNTWGALTAANAATNNTATTTATNNTATNSTGFQYNAYQQSDAVKQAQALLNQQLANKPNVTTPNTPYQESDAVKQAQALLNQQLAQKPGAYQSQWQTQLNDVMDKILNREKFSYDVNGDALYQQYKDQYMMQGQQAMMDTMGQAAAMTGGYGNSYAQSAGQQAYQSYLNQLNDKIPELYQIALNKYQMEGDALMNQYGMLSTQEQQDYGRYRDTVSDWNSEVDRLQSQYNTERDYDYGKYVDDRNYQYQVGRDQIADWQAELDRLQTQYNAERDYDYGMWADNRDFGYGQYRDQITDSQWQAEFDEAVRQFNFANGIGEFAPVAAAGGGGDGGSGGGGGGGNPNPEEEEVNTTNVNTAYRLYQQGVSQGYGSNNSKNALTSAGFTDAEVSAAMDKYEEEVIKPLSKPVKKNGQVM